MLVIKHANLSIVEDGLAETLQGESDSCRTGINQQVVSQKEGESAPTAAHNHQNATITFEVTCLQCDELSVIRDTLLNHLK